MLFDMYESHICAFQLPRNWTSVLIVIHYNQLRSPFVTSGCVLNANPRVNAYFIAFVIAEHAVLENWFIHLAIYTKTDKF